MTRLTRSSYVKIALIVALALLLFAVAGAGAMRGCSQGIYLGGGTEMGNASVDAKSERNLSVSWAAGSVDISVVDDGAGDVIELVETAPTGLTKAQQMRWSVSGGTLKVDYGSWWSCFALGQKRLEVRIPERYAQSLGAVTVDGASGYYRVAGIGCDTLRLKLASGEIDADGLAAAALDVDVASGQVRAEGTSEEIVPARCFTGNRPTTSIFGDELSPFALGELIALYEHITFVEGTVWGIDSYDQWGVELGKQLAKQITPAFHDDEALAAQDASTQALIQFYRAHRK